MAILKLIIKSTTTHYKTDCYLPLVTEEVFTAKAPFDRIVSYVQKG